MPPVSDEFKQNLQKELALWYQKGWIKQRSYQQIAQYYQITVPQPNSHRMSQIWVILSTLLLSLGIISLFSANWYELNRYTQLTLAAIPLLLAQILNTQTHRFHAIYREGIALFWFMSVGIILALIGQIYQIPENEMLFLRMWWFLTLPIIYLRQSYAALTASLLLYFYLANIDYFATVAHSAKISWDIILMPFVFLVFLIQHWQTNLSWQQQTHAWRFQAALLALTMMTLITIYGNIWSKSIMAMALYLYGNSQQNQPKTALSMIGIAYLAMGPLFMGNFARTSIHWQHFDVVYLATAIGFIIIALRHHQKIGYASLAWAGTSLLLLATHYQNRYLNMLAIFIFSLWFAFDGLKKQQTFTVNMALAWLSAWIAWQLFDAHWSLTIKGIIFMMMGGLILMMNLKLRKQHHDDMA